MINKITKKLRREGLKGLIFAFINKILIYLLNIRIIENKSIRQNKIAKRIFLNKTLKYDSSGFFYISPMPSKEELSNYYKTSYWESRENINFRVLINRRDLIHYKIISKLIPEFLVKNNVFLNYGSGHGGISHLLKDIGLKIINVDHAQIPLYYNENWSKHNNTKEIEDHSVDIIYGSHSLEHVQNISEIQNEFKRILKPNGILFFEVPNADSNSAGPPKNKILIPHTYYFKKSFFEKWFTKIILVESFLQNEYEDIDGFTNDRDEKGEIIIAIGTL